MRRVMRKLLPVSYTHLDSRVPALFSDRDIVLGNQERNQGVRLAAATGRGGPRRGGSYDFEEVSTVHG